MYDHTITVFNFHAATEMWYPTVLTGANLYQADSANLTTGNGIVNAASVEVIIHVSRDQSATTGDVEPNHIVDYYKNCIVTAAGDMLSHRRLGAAQVKQYVSPKAFSRLAEPEGYFTFQPEKDFLMSGVWPDTDPVRDDAYEHGFYDAMNAENDGVYMITSAAFYGLLPHFEIGGR